MWRSHSRRVVTIVAIFVVVGIVAGSVWLLRANDSERIALSGLGSSGSTDAESIGTNREEDTGPEKAQSPADTVGSASGTPADAPFASSGGDQTGISIPEGAAETTRTGLTLVELGRVDVPESYDVVLYFAGWQEDIRMPVVEVVEAELLGEIDPITGEASGDSQAGAADHSAELVGLWVMAEPSGSAAAALRDEGTYRVRLVLMPGEGAVVPRIDRAVRE